MELAYIKEIIQLMKENDLKVFSLKDENSKLYLESHAKYAEVAPLTQTTISGDSSSVKSETTAAQSELIEIRADQIGIFYTQPDAESTETFVKVGDEVGVGDQIGLIEIMKLFNEVRVEQAGIIEKILVSNGEPVEFDQVLMLLRPKED